MLYKKGFVIRHVLIGVCFSGFLALSGCGSDKTIEDPIDPDGGTGDVPVNPEGDFAGTVGEEIPLEQQRVIDTSEVRPYRANGPYAPVLKDCTLASSDSLCTLETLPYIGQSSLNPTIDNIMDHVLVTHDWMGVRFEQMLNRLPADILYLFSSVTSVIIGSDVRPSSYSAIRGRVSLDPDYLWVSVPEKRTVSIAPDFRSDYGADLKFVSRWNIMLGDDYAVPYSSLTDDNPRPITSLDINLARLLYHELAHANDYVPVNQIANLSLSLTPREAIDQLENVRVSTLLGNDEALTAQQSYLYGLAGVRYFDDEATEFQKSLLADFVGAQMGNEGKVTFYGYSTTREDVATLFDAVMMKYHYGTEVRVGFANKPANYPDAFCDDYKVAWGLRNRIASPLVVSRVQYVVDKILPPSAALDAFISSGLGQAIPLREGEGWCESRFLNPQLAKGRVEGLEWTMTFDHELHEDH